MTSLVNGPASSRAVFNSDQPLPVIPEEITASWLSEALGVEVNGFEITSVDHGTASKIFITLEFSDGVETDVPTRICVKGGFNPVIAQIFPEMLATYRREAEFYHYIAPLTKMLLPRTWFCGSDTVNGQGIVILSNVADECSFGTPLEPWTPSRVEGALKQLASLHGRTWNSDEKDYPWLFGKDGEKLANPVRNIVLALLRPEPWAIRFDEACRPPVAEPLLDRERIQKGFEALWQHADSDLRFYSLIHGDNHIGNTLIANNGTPGFIDWQGLQYGPAILDLVYFLTGALTVEDRRNHEEALIETYLEALHAEGGPKLSREDVWDDYRRYAMQGFLWAMTPSNMQPDEVIFGISERYSAAIVDHGTLELLGV